MTRVVKLHARPTMLLKQAGGNVVPAFGFEDLMTETLDIYATTVDKRDSYLARVKNTTEEDLLYKRKISIGWIGTVFESASNKKQKNKKKNKSLPITNSDGKHNCCGSGCGTDSIRGCVFASAHSRRHALRYHYHIWRPARQSVPDHSGGNHLWQRGCPLWGWDCCRKPHRAFEGRPRSQRGFNGLSQSLLPPCSLLHTLTLLPPPSLSLR